MAIAFFLFIILGSTEKVAPSVNSFLDSYWKHIRIALFVIAFSSLGLLFVPDLIAIKETGGIALELLWIILFIPIFAKVFNRPLARKFIPWRKEIGILMGMFGLVHSLQYFSAGGLWANVMDPSFWSGNFSMPFFSVGLIALVITMLLLVTSNVYSMKKLKKYWKLLHRFVYPLIILVIAHVILIKWSGTGQIPWEELIPLVAYFGLKTAEWRGVSFFVPRKIFPVPGVSD